MNELNITITEEIFNVKVYVFKDEGVVKANFLRTDVRVTKLGDETFYGYYFLDCLSEWYERRN